MSEAQKITATLKGRQIEFESSDSALLFIAHFASFRLFNAYHLQLKGTAPPWNLQRQLKAKMQDFQTMVQTLCFTDGTPLHKVFSTKR